MPFSRHARKHFSQAEGSQLDEVRQVMGMLAFPPDTHISPYKVTRGHEGRSHTLLLRVGVRRTLRGGLRQGLPDSGGLQGPALRAGVSAQARSGPSLGRHVRPGGVSPVEPEGRPPTR